MKRLKKHIFNNAEKKGKHNNCSFNNTVLNKNLKNYCPHKSEVCVDFFIDFEKEPLDNSFEIFREVAQKVYPAKTED